MRPLTQVLATLAGVVRRGTPLILDRLHHPLHGNACTVHATDGDAASVIVDDCPDVILLDLDCATIDMTDATGRAHVAWALGLRAGTPTQGMAAHRLHDHSGAHTGNPGAACVCFARWVTDPRWVDPTKRGVVPSLADLDPNDDTRLPDGSRWVDAEALARVAVHVLGGSDD